MRRSYILIEMTFGFSFKKLKEFFPCLQSKVIVGNDKSLYKKEGNNMARIFEEKGARISKRFATEYIKKYAGDIEETTGATNLSLGRKEDSQYTSSRYWNVHGDVQKEVSTKYWLEEGMATTLEECLELSKQIMSKDSYIKDGKIYYDTNTVIGQVRVSHHEKWQDSFVQDYVDGVFTVFIED